MTDGRQALTRARVTIDLDAVAANYQLLTDRLNGRRPAAMVKADGYGTGAGPVARRLLVEGCRRFFVARLDEGLSLRHELSDHEGPEPEILVLDGPLGSSAEMRAGNLVPVLNDLGQVEQWRAEATSVGRPLAAALHFDTGMTRLGLPTSQAATLMEEPRLLDGIEVGHVMSHLASADVPGSSQPSQQLTRFQALRQRFPQGLASIANSAGIFLAPDYHLDLARPGIALYGGAPQPDRPNPMEAVVTLEAPIVQSQRVEANTAIGYGATHSTEQATILATVATGYADGYLRSASGLGTVAIGGVSAPIVGRISMDLIAVDVGHLDPNEVHPGTAVELIGPNRPVDEVASDAGTIANEILTNLGSRYERRYRSRTHSQ